VNSACISRCLEQVLPSLQRTVMVEVMPEDERARAANYSSRFELNGNAASGIPRAQKHEFLLPWVERH